MKKSSEGGSRFTYHDNDFGMSKIGIIKDAIGLHPEVLNTNWLPMRDEPAKQVYGEACISSFLR